MGLTLVGGGEAPGGDGGDSAAPRHRHVVEAEDLVLRAGVKHRAGEHHRLVTLAWGIQRVLTACLISRLPPG